MATNRLYDVIVVGAGLAGLSAAYQLTLAGRHTLVLEGSSHIGGRILSQRIDGTTIDHGGQWVNSTHSNFIELSTSLGLFLEQHQHPGAHRFALEGVINEFDGALPKVSFTDRITLNRLAKNLEKATRDIDIERPWLSPQANELDKQRFSQYLKNNLLTKRHFSLIKPIFEAHFLNGIDQISALQGVLEWQEKDKQKFQILGGTYQLPRKLAQEVDILSRQQVKQINMEGSFARIVTQQQEFRCRHVLVALPPTQSAEIRYDPSISTSKGSMWDAIKPGRIIKSSLIFEEPFWRGKSWSGKAYVGSDSPFQFLIDAGTSLDERGIISTYSIGNHCIHLEKLTPAEKKEVILNQVLKILPCSAGDQPIYFQMYDWKCPPNGYGAYHIFPPGLLTNFEDHLTKPENVISWASAEYDPLYRGTMEGAIRSGLHAVQRILSV